jgi:D-alanyl-D-alanine carboxypeptidase
VKPGRNIPAPLVAAALALSAAFLHGVPAAGAEDYEPKRCATAVGYVGAPLHAPLDTALFSGLDGAMTGALDDSLVARLDGAVSWILANTRAPGITAAVGIPGQGIWSVSRGLARLEPPTPFAPRALFYWGSVGKAFTAAVVAQLIEEGKLADTDPLARWFPDFPNAGAITVDHLLTHTSGAFSFNQDLKFRRKKGYTAPDELIRIAARHGNALCPGERWSYSNTGYVLLARIVERIEGLPFHQIVTRRVIDRSGLQGTVALAPEQTPAGLATGHVAGKPDADFDPSMPFGAGIIAAPADEMIRFWQALLAGRVVGTASLRRAFDHLYPMYDPGTFYGRGVMVIEFKAGDGPQNVWLGHGGGTPSAKAVIAYDTTSRVFIAVAINGDVSAEAAAYRLLKEVRAWRTSKQG